MNEDKDLMTPEAAAEETVTVESEINESPAEAEADAPETLSETAAENITEASVAEAASEIGAEADAGQTAAENIAEASAAEVASENGAETGAAETASEASANETAAEASIVETTADASIAETAAEAVVAETAAKAESTEDFEDLPPLSEDTDYSEKKKSKKPIIAGCCCLALVAALYGAGVYYYSDHLHFNTVANGKSLRNMTVAEAEKAFTEDYDSLQISLKEKERTEIVHLEDLNAKIAVGSQIQDMMDSQNKWLWFMDVYGSSDYEVKLDVTYDETALKNTVDQLECFKAENVTAPADCYIKAGDTAFQIYPEVLGNTVKEADLITSIEDALTKSETTIDLEKADLYELPEYYADDDVVKEALATANKYASSNITYDFSYTTENLDYSTIKDFIKISKDFKVSLNKSKVEDYVYDLSSKYNTMGRAKKFKTTSGRTITITEGDYGWKIYHDKETKTLMQNIKDGKTLTREPEYSYTAQCRKSETDDIGDSYVEVSISAQEVWLYVDGDCKLDTSCVTGDATQHHDTTKGIYAITYKTSPATLTGPNANGTSYSSEVTYWMPFNGNQGLHDATWRDSFGGSIYKGNGSHGCVNLPYSSAKTIYKYVDEGFPVIIY